MIDKALKTLGKKRCPECSKLLNEDVKKCGKCGYSFVKTSTPEDGLTRHD